MNNKIMVTALVFMIGVSVAAILFKVGDDTAEPIELQDSEQAERTVEEVLDVVSIEIEEPVQIRIKNGTASELEDSGCGIIECTDRRLQYCKCVDWR